MSEGGEILKALAIAAEVTGAEFSRGALLAMEAELAPFGNAAVVAIRAAMRESRGRITLAEVIARLPSQDNRPTAAEAWAIAVAALDESRTVVWNDEIAGAWADSREIADYGDETGARLAFRDSYERRVATNRVAGTLPRWSPSLGHCPHSRGAALADAVRRGRLGADHARRLVGGNRDAVALIEKAATESPALPGVEKTPAQLTAF